jgi:hypothetical protein
MRSRSNRLFTSRFFALLRVSGFQVFISHEAGNHYTSGSHGSDNHLAVSTERQAGHES